MSGIAPDAILPPPPVQPWDKLPDESPESFEGFLVYKDLPLAGRTFAAVAQTLGKHRNGVERHAARNSWRERAAAWDTWQARQREDADDQRLRSEQLELRRSQSEGIKRHLAIGRALQAQALRIIQREQKKPDAVGPDPRAIDMASKALERGITVERLALGLPTDVTQQSIQLKTQVEQTMELVDRVKAVIAENLCDDCLARVSDELRRLSARQRAVSGQL